MIHRSRSTIAAGLLLGLTAMVAVTGPSSCEDTDPACKVEPTGSIVTYVVSHPELMHYHATVRVLSVSSFDSTGMQTLVVRDTTTAAVDTLVYGAPPSTKVPPVPLRIGDLVTVTLDHVGGWPTVQGILITDGIGVLFAAASDDRPGGHVLKDGLPGFTLELLPPTCDSRPHNDCYDSIRNAPFRVTHGSDSVTVYHGESADIDPWVVHCFTAQAVEYNSNCADAGLIGLSYAVARRVPQVLPDAK
jgi:hypothetical protein